MTKKHVHPVLDQDVVKPWDNEPFPLVTSSSIQRQIDSMDSDRRKTMKGDWGEYDLQKRANAASAVTVVIVNLNTLHLMNGCLRSLHVAYPNVRTIVVDNGSNDGSKHALDGLDMPICVRSIILPKNIGHGPAMHKAIRQVKTPMFLTMDTDTVVQKPGFIEYMVEWLASGNNKYAVGWRRLVHKHSGVPISWSPHQRVPKNSIDYIHPYCGMYKTEIYRKLPPFEHHGAPCISNMRQAVKRGYGLKGFPNTNQYRLGDYVRHLTGGTRRMYPVPDWDPKQQKPKKWNPKTVLNI